MLGRRARLATWLKHCGINHSARGLSSQFSKNVIILAYHRVKPITDEARYPFDLDLISACPEDFLWQLEYVRKHYDVISFSDLIAAQEQKQSLPKRPLIITFDDGFDDNYHYAYPLLKQAKLPATIFLAVDYVDQPQTFWFEQVMYLITQTQQKNLALPELALNIAFNSDIHQKRQAAHSVLAKLKTVKEATRIEVVQRLQDYLGVLPPLNQVESRAMNWQQIQTMAQNGIEFGSHGCSHAILTQLSEEKLYHEIVDSKTIIEQQLGKPVQVLAYPIGRMPDFNQKIEKLTKHSGYKMAVSYISGINSLPVRNNYALRRLHIERYVSRSLFAAMIDMPWIFHE